MRKLNKMTTALQLAMAFSATGVAVADSSHCDHQAERILARLQTEVLGELSATERGKAQRIVLDVCQAREQQVEKQVEQAIQDVRAEEEEKANSWFTESADKPGNKRLKRKTH